MPDGRSITIPVNGTSAAVALWSAASTLIIVDIVIDEGRLGRAGVLIGLMAVCLTINCLLRHHRRVVLEVMNYEFRMRDDTDGGTVMPLQRAGLAGRRTKVD